MSKSFWEDDAVEASSKGAPTTGNFWEGDADAAKADLPKDVKPSTAGGGRGSVNPETTEEAEASKPAFVTPSMKRATKAPKKAGSILDEPIPGYADRPLSDVEAAELVRDERRANYDERTSPVRPSARGVDRPKDDIQALRGEAWGRNTGFAGRIVGKTAAGIAEGLGGTVRAVGDVTGSETLQKVGKATAGGAEAFRKGMGEEGSIEGFGPKSPAPYLRDMGENIGESLGQTLAISAGGGAKSVIGGLSLMQAGQSYNEAREAGRDPAAALARAIPQGAFEAIGEKFSGLDRAVGALGTILNKGASSAAKRSAGDELVRLGIREIPGEVITYLGQTGTDLLPGVGLNPNLTMSQFLDGLRDTVIAAGGMGAISGGAGLAVRRRAAESQQMAAPEPSLAAQMARSRGFLTPEAGQPPAAAGEAPGGPVSPVPGAVAPEAAPAAVANPAGSPQKSPVPTPEPLSDTAAQVAAIRDPSSGKTAALITPNSPMEGIDLKGLHVVSTPMGQFVTSDADKARAVETLGQGITDEQMGMALGYTTPKGASDGTVVQAVNANGDVIHEEATNAEQAPVAAAAAQQMAPDGGAVVQTDALAAQQRRAEKQPGALERAAAAVHGDNPPPLAMLGDPKARPKSLAEQMDSQRAVDELEARQAADADFEAAMAADTLLADPAQTQQEQIDLANAPKEKKSAATPSPAPSPAPAPAAQAPAPKSASAPSGDEVAAQPRRPTGDQNADAGSADGKPVKAKPAMGQAGSEDGTHASVEAATDFIKAQRARGANVAAVPVVGDDGKVRIATQGTPDYARGVEQREQRRQAERRAEAGILDGDVMRPNGEPFKNKRAASDAAKKAGDGFAPVEVKGGFVARKQAEAQAASAPGPDWLTEQIRAQRATKARHAGGKPTPLGAEDVAPITPFHDDATIEKLRERITQELLDGKKLGDLGITFGADDHELTIVVGGKAVTHMGRGRTDAILKRETVTELDLLNALKTSGPDLKKMPAPRAQVAIEKGATDERDTSRRTDAAAGGSGARPGADSGRGVGAARRRAGQPADTVPAAPVEPGERAEPARLDAGRGKPGAVGQKIGADEPALAKGMVRLYHGSATPGRYDGKAWFSTDRQYAANYRQGAELQYVDMPADKINAIADPDGYGQTVEAGFTVNREFDSSETGPRRPLLGTAADRVDAAAHEAATSEQNDKAAPTDAQKAAGNYAMGHLSGPDVQGLDLTIENPKGSERSGTSPDGTKWSNTMGAHYGYAKRSEAADGDHVDVFVGPHAATAPRVWVIDQLNADGTYDEAKALFGFKNKRAAVDAYKASYSKGWKVGPVTEMSVDEFKAGLESGRFKQPLDPGLHKIAKSTFTPDVKMPEGLVEIPADPEAFADAMNEALAQADGEDARLAATFRPDIKPVTLPLAVDGTKASPKLPSVGKKEAAARLKAWKDEAARQGRENVSANANRTVISLFDVSGVMAQPWIDAGYNVYTYDLQTGDDINDFDAQTLLERHGNEEIYAILAQPPCTDFTNSGARWWKDKDADGRTEASNELVRQTLRTVELFRPPVWVMENPTGRIAKLNNLPKPLLSFDPWHFGDDYTKRTQLFGKFDPNLPTAPVDPTQGSKMHKLSSSAKYERSLTSENFAYALFMANNAEGKSQAQRMADEFAGVDAKLFEAAVEAGHTPFDIKNAIEDAYYDSDLETVRDELAKLGDNPTTPPAPPAPPAPAPAAPDAAQQRADAADAEKKRRAAGDRARARAWDDNPGRAFIAKHGIALDLASEWAPGAAERRAAMVQGYGPIFRKSGMQLDTLAQAAVEEGFLLEPDEQQLHALIDRAIRKQRVVPQYAEGVGESELEARIAQQRQYEEDAFEAINNPDLSDAFLDALQDADIPWDSAGQQASTEAFLRELGATDEEIRLELEQLQDTAAQRRAESAAGPVEGQPSAAQAPDTAGEGRARGQRRAARGAPGEAQSAVQGVEEGKAQQDLYRYTRDLFGSPVPQQPAPAAAPAEAPKANDTKAPDGDYYARTIVGVSAPRKIAGTHVNSMADVARATRLLYRQAVERFDGVVTDKDGKILGVIGGFKGALAQASVYPATLVGEAVRIPGAANVWFSHNHPSGRPELSDADRRLYSTLHDVFAGSGIEARGLIAIGNGEFNGTEISDGTDTVRGRVAESGGVAEVPTFEREFPDGAARSSGATIDSPAMARAMAKSFYERAKQPGIMLLNTQLGVVGWVPITDAMQGRLRGTGGLNAVYRAISESNAGAAIVVHGGELNSGRDVMRPALNIGAALAKVDVRALDVIDVATGTSAAEQGMPTTSKTLLSVANDVDESTGLPLNKDGTVTVYHHTSADAAAKIASTGRLKAEAEPDVYVTTRRETDTGYGDTAVAIRVKPERLQLDDEFPDGRRDFRLSVGRPGGSVAVKVEPDSALRTAEGGSIEVKTTPASADHERKAEKLLERLRANQRSFLSFQAVEPATEGEAGQHLAAVRTAAKRLFGHDVVFVRFNGPASFNGAMSHAIPNTVFIRIDSAKPHMAVLGHELLHALRRQNPVLYRGMENRLMELLADKHTEFYDDLSKSYERIGREMPEEWHEELWADVVGDNFLRPEFWQGIAAEQPGLFRRVANAITRLLDGIIQKLGQLTGFGTDQFLTDAQEARRVVTAGMRQFSRAMSGQTGIDGVASKATALPKTDSPAFRRWFKDSKVVDDAGKPLVMYHGTNKSEGGDAFRYFDTYASNYGLMGQGGYFTANPEVASSYTKKGRGDAPTVYPVYLAIKNPIDMDAPGDRATWEKGFPNVDFDEYAPEKPTNEGFYRAVETHYEDEQLPRYEGAELMQEGLRRAGFDGITHMGGGRVQNADVAVRHRVFIAFDPEQIKSSTGNNGDFDPTKLDMHLSVASPADQPKKNQAVLSRAIFEGSVRYTRDQNGKPVPLDDQKKRYEAIDTDERGQMLLRKGIVTADQLKRWKASPLDVYDAAVNKRFTQHFEQPGVVWKDEELRTRFKMDDAGIEAYRNLRAQADTHITRKAVHDMLRTAGDLVDKETRAQVLAEPLEIAATTLRDKLLEDVEGETPAARRMRIDKANEVIDVLDEAHDRMEAGHVPEEMRDDVRPSDWEAPTDKKGRIARTLEHVGIDLDVDRVIYEMQDGRVDLKRVQEAITKAGNTIREEFDARLAETLYSGRVAKRTTTFLEDEARPLLQLMAKHGIDQVEFGDYLHARAAPERNEQVAKVNPQMPDGGAGSNSKGLLLTTKAALDYVAAIPAERRQLLESMAKHVDAITKGTRSLLVAEGLEEADTIAAWEAVYSTYVPMFREDVEFSRITTHVRATGSEKKAVNILANVLLQREAAITKAEKNRVKVALYGLALTNPNPRFWTTIRPEGSKEEVTKALVGMGIDPVQAEAGMSAGPRVTKLDPVSGKVVEVLNPYLGSLPTAITMKVNGQTRILLLNEEDPRAVRMAASLKGTDNLTQLDLAGSIVGRATRWMAAVNTQYNPVFGIVNFWRDTTGGVIHLGNTELRGSAAKVMAGLPGALRGIGAHLMGTKDPGKWAQLFEQFQQDGGQTGFREMFADGAARAAAVEKELARMSRSRLDPRRAALFIGKLLGGFNEVMENAVRLSAYAAALDKGISRAEAARLGRELTVDFNRKGRATRELGPLYAFFNASLQGSERTLRALRGPTGKTIIAGGLALGVAQALMLAAAGYDDDEIPDYAKARALIVPLFNKDRSYLVIPLPLGLHVLPNTGRVLTEMAIGDRKGLGKKAFDAVGEISGAFNPLGGGNIFTPDGALRTIAPTVIDPVIELGFNRNFAGSPIEREVRGEADVRPGHQRARESTQRRLSGQAYLGISKALNSMTGGSDVERGAISPTPERLRYLSQVALGGVLRETERIADATASKAAGRNVPWSGVPLASRFFGQIESERTEQSRYYENLRAIDKAKNGLAAAKKAGNTDVMEKIMANDPMAPFIKSATRIQHSIGKLNKLAVEVIDDPAKQKEVDEARTEAMKTLNDAIKEAELQRRGPTIADRIKMTP